MTLAESWPVLAVAIPALVGYGELRAKVGSLRKDVDEKASRDVTNTQYAEILRRLDRIERRMNGVAHE